jgi:uncharacterized protein YlxW (UPF0749 family)
MKQKIDVVFSKKNPAQTLLYQYLTNEVKLIIEALTIFYLPMALIEEAASEDKVDRAADESIAKLKAQIEIVEKQRSRYTGSSSFRSIDQNVDNSMAENDESDDEGEESLEDLYILLKKL